MMSVIDQSRLVLNTINKMLFFHSGLERQQDFGRQVFRRKLGGWFQIMID